MNLPEGFEDKFGYPVKYLQPQWETLFQIIIQYITCDGRYATVHFYHLRFLMASKGSKMNLPYFLLNSLWKMASAIQKNIGDKYRSLFHHGLVKILVKYQLSFIGKSWDQFIDENGFGQNEVWPFVRPKTRQKRRRSRGSETAEVNDELNHKDSRVKISTRLIGLQHELIEVKP